MTELNLVIIISLILLAFICEYVDSTLGMGYGTALAPMLLLFGFKPLQIVPIILLSEIITGLLAALLHHREGNVNFKFFKNGISHHLKIALILVACSIIGTIAAVFVAVNIPKFWLKMYIGCLVFVMGIIIFITLNKKYSFSWSKIILLGLIASFNKGISGGGYGPVVMGGQILSGVESKNAIGITSLSESLTCFVGIITYLLTVKNGIDWTLTPYIVTGAVIAVPFSAKSVKRISVQNLKLAIAALTIFLGIITMVKTLSSLI